MLDKNNIIKQFEIIDEMTEAMDKLIDVITLNSFAIDNFKNHIGLVFNHFINIIGQFPPVIVHSDLTDDIELNIYKSFETVANEWDKENTDLERFIKFWDDYKECWEKYYLNMKNSSSLGLMYLSLN